MRCLFPFLPLHTLLKKSEIFTTSEKFIYVAMTARFCLTTMCILIYIYDDFIVLKEPNYSRVTISLNNMDMGVIIVGPESGQSNIKYMGFKDGKKSKMILSDQVFQLSSDIVIVSSSNILRPTTMDLLKATLNILNHCKTMLKVSGKMRWMKEVMKPFNKLKSVPHATCRVFISPKQAREIHALQGE